MDNDSHPSYLYTGEFLNPEEVRIALLQKDPQTYGDFKPRDWEALSERLEAVARLVWRIALRQTSSAGEDRILPETQTDTPDAHST